MGDGVFGPFTRWICLVSLVLCLGFEFYAIRGFLREPSRWQEWLGGVLFFGVGTIVLVAIVGMRRGQRPGRSRMVVMGTSGILLGVIGTLATEGHAQGIFAGSIFVALGIVGLFRALRSP